MINDFIIYLVVNNILKNIPRYWNCRTEFQGSPSDALKAEIR